MCKQLHGSSVGSIEVQRPIELNADLYKPGGQGHNADQPSSPRQNWWITRGVGTISQTLFLSPFRRFAAASQIVGSCTSGLLLLLKDSSPFRAVCCCCSNTPINVERFAPAVCLPLSRTNALVPFARFASVSQILSLLAGGLPYFSQFLMVRLRL